MFAERVGAFLGDFFRLYPVAATAAGNHAHDGEWPNLTDAGQADRLAFIDDWTAELQAMPAASLTPDARIDRDHHEQTRHQHGRPRASRQADQG